MGRLTGGSGAWCFGEIRVSKYLVARQNRFENPIANDRKTAEADRITSATDL